MLCVCFTCFLRDTQKRKRESLWSRDKFSAAPCATLMSGLFWVCWGSSSTSDLREQIALLTCQYNVWIQNQDAVMCSAILMQEPPTLQKDSDETHQLSWQRLVSPPRPTAPPDPVALFAFFHFSFNRLVLSSGARQSQPKKKNSPRCVTDKWESWFECDSSPIWLTASHVWVMLGLRAPQKGSSWKPSLRGNRNLLWGNGRQHEQTPPTVCLQSGSVGHMCFDLVPVFCVSSDGLWSLTGLMEGGGLWGKLFLKRAKSGIPTTAVTLTQKLCAR